MTMTKMNRSRQQLEAAIIERAHQDPAFRTALTADPRAALANFLGMTLPPGIEITILEEQPGQHYLVLPPAQPMLEALPLGDLELALIGGGRTMRPGGQAECTENDDFGRSRSNRRSSC